MPISLKPMINKAHRYSTTEVPHAERPKLRGRPTKAHAPVIDADIIRAATEMFGEVGYRATTMEAIATKVGIAKRTLYTRYPDKIALYKDVCTLIVANAQTPEPPSFPDLRTCLMFHTENYFVIASDPAMRVLRSLGDTEVQSLPELVAIGQELTRDIGTVPIGKTIAAAAKKDKLVVSDPEFIASAIIDLASGHFTRVELLKLRNDFASFKFAAERIVNLLMAGILAENAAAAKKT